MRPSGRHCDTSRLGALREYEETHSFFLRCAALHLSDQTTMPSRREPFCPPRFLGNASSLCAEKTNAAMTLPPLIPCTHSRRCMSHSAAPSDKRSHAGPRLRGPARTVASSSPPLALLPQRLAARMPHEITRWLAVREIVASQGCLFHRLVVKMLYACSCLARAGLRLNLSAVWRIVGRSDVLLIQRSGIRSESASHGCYVFGKTLLGCMHP